MRLAGLCPAPSAVREPAGSFVCARGSRPPRLRAAVRGESGPRRARRPVRGPGRVLSTETFRVPALLVQARLTVPGCGRPRAYGMAEAGPRAGSSGTGCSLRSRRAASVSILAPARGATAEVTVGGRNSGVSIPVSIRASVRARERWRVSAKMPGARPGFSLRFRTARGRACPSRIV